MDQVQWALKELTALREEHQKIGLRVQKLEQILMQASGPVQSNGQPNDQNGHSSPLPSPQPNGNPVVPPLNIARARDLTPEIAQSPTLSHKSLLLPDTPADNNTIGDDTTPVEDETTPKLKAEELTSPALVEEMCSNLYNIGTLKSKVEIGLIAKSVPKMRHYREEPCVVLHVATRNSYWYVAKTINQLKNLDTALRTFQQTLPQLPTKDQWNSYSPIKIDIRIDLLDSYLTQVNELIQNMFPTSQAVYLQFLATDIVKINHSVCCSYLVSRSRFSGWKSRYCVLNSSTLDILDKPGGSIGQSINLASAHISSISDNITASDDEYRYGFMISEQKENSSKTTSHFFSCESEAVRTKWLRSFQNRTSLPKVTGMEATLPFLAIHEGSLGSPEIDTHSISQESHVSGSLPIPNLREKTRRRQSSLNIDFKPRLSSEGGSSRISSPQSAIAITHPSSGPTSAFASHMRVLSPPSAHSNSPLSGPGPATFHTASGTMRSNVFRVSLDSALAYSSVTIGSAVVPTLVGRCINFLYSKSAYLEEGLFRISGTQSQVDNLEIRFERDDVDVDDLVRNNYDVHVVSSVLKRYFRLLPEPLIPQQDESFWGETMSKDHAQRTLALRDLILSLPQTKYDVLDIMTQFLGDVHRNSDVNKMTPQNLGIVFSPTLGIPGPVIIALIEDQKNIVSRV